MEPERRGIHFKGNLTWIHLLHLTNGLIAANRLACGIEQQSSLQEGLPVQETSMQLAFPACPQSPVPARSPCQPGVAARSSPAARVLICTMAAQPAAACWSSWLQLQRGGTPPRSHHFFRGDHTHLSWKQSQTFSKVVQPRVGKRACKGALWDTRNETRVTYLRCKCVHAGMTVSVTS